MAGAQRHQVLLDMLTQLGFITVESVTERLGISSAVTRRDINKLDESGKFKKVRNSAEAITQQRPRWMPMDPHQTQDHDEKVRIAKAASQPVNTGESMVIDCGSTVFLLGREVCGKPVQVITNYPPLVSYLIDQEYDSMIIMGKRYSKSQSTVLSPQGNENNLCVGHWMFINDKGLTADGLYKTGMLTVTAGQKTLNMVGKLVVSIDSSRISGHTGILFDRANQIDALVTGENANPEILQQLEAQDMNAMRV